MNRQAYAQKVMEIAAEKPEYGLGGDGSDGTCDCVGLGIGALRRGGITYKGLHGSNWAARNEAVELWRIDRVSALRVGDNVLKAREPGEAGWALPERYAQDGDQRDYYHMGVVTSLDPLRIVHCSEGGIQIDTALGRWAYAFLWRQLSESDEAADEEALYSAVVTTARDPLRIRDWPIDGAVIGHAQKGAVVEVLESGAWPRIRHGGVVGYAFGAYLTAVDGEAGGAQADGGEQAETAGPGYTTIMREDGVAVMLVGRWRVAED